MKMAVLMWLLMGTRSIEDSWSCALKGESRPEDIQRHALLNLVRSSLSTIDMLVTSLRMLTPVMHPPWLEKLRSGSACALLWRLAIVYHPQAPSERLDFHKV